MKIDLWQPLKMLVYYSGYTTITSNMINYADLQIDTSDMINTIYDAGIYLLIYCGRYIYVVCKMRRDYHRILRANMFGNASSNINSWLSVPGCSSTRSDYYIELICKIKSSCRPVTLLTAAKGPFRGFADICVTAEN